MTETMVIGVDGGLTGAMALLHGNEAHVFDLPTRPLIGGGHITKRIDGRVLRQLLRDNVPANTPVVFVIEQLATGGMDRGQAATVNSQHRTRGTIEGIVECLNLEVQEVSPARWKKFYGLNNPRGAVAVKGKKDSLLMARDLYPGLAQQDLHQAQHHNRAEAVLIAHWARKVLA